LSTRTTRPTTPSSSTRRWRRSSARHERPADVPRVRDRPEQRYFPGNDLQPVQGEPCGRALVSGADRWKVRADGAPFDTFFVATPLIDGLTAVTHVDKPKGLWVSTAQIPLGFFNVDDGQAKGTQWRMNFFRIITAPSTFPAQFYGAWSQPDEANFHMTPYFGFVHFV
jgi:hypothetical protein